MSLWIDLTDLKSWKGNFTGIQRVVYNLAVRYAANNNIKFFRFSRKHSRIFEYPFSLLSTCQNPDKEIQSHPVRLKLYQKILGIRQKQRPIKLTSNDTLLVLGAIWNRPETFTKLSEAKRSSGFKLLVLVYDLIPIYAPHMFSQTLCKNFKHYLSQTLVTADALVTISRASRHDIERFSRENGINPPPIHQIRLGDELDNISASAVPGLVPGGFILMLGTLEFRKNPLLVYLMVKQAILDGIELPPIIMVGKPGWIRGQYDFIRKIVQLDPEIGTKIRLMNDLEDSAVKWLYQNCIFSIFPSFYEGWGLPVAESLRYGKLCLTSSISSMPEIAADLLEYFSPYDTKGLLGLVQKYLDPEVRARKERELAAHFKPQDWDACFAQFDAIVQQLQAEVKLNLP